MPSYVLQIRIYKSIYVFYHSTNCNICFMNLKSKPLPILEAHVLPGLFEISFKLFIFCPICSENLKRDTYGQT